MRNLTLKSRRTRTSCSVIALATVLVVGATPAAAQSFLGSGSFTHNGGGSAGITTAPNLTTITVNPGSTVIDWSPNDTGIGGGTINFQPAGTTANFLGSGNFAVLNRINPADSTRSISMNGTIQTLALGAAAAANGSLYFYTPGGFVIGANAIINVGSLVLSASPITVDGNGTFINGVDRSVTFGQASQTAAQISIASGAQINALANTGSYVAVVAPNVIHNGTINNSGSTALVAAEAATINFSPDGLFDIQVTSGTSSTFGISTTGNIGGAASSGAGVNHRIHLVAVPKNQALTMVIGAGADLGFDVAGAANVDGNAIVLSAGYDVVDGVAGTVRSAGGGSGNSNISAFNFNATSALNAAATNNIDMGSTIGASVFSSAVTLRAPNEALLRATGASASLQILGNVSISADRTIAAGSSGTAGLAAFYSTDGGSITAGQDLTVTADATGAGSLVSGVAGGSATGGSVRVQTQTGGELTILGDSIFRADGTGGDALTLGAAGGQGRGGAIQFMTFDDSSTVVASGNVSASATGIGGASSLSGTPGAIGRGGTMSIGAQSTNSSFTLNGDLSVIADGQGGAALGAGVNGGSGFGGSIFITARTSGAATLINGNVNAFANGYGGMSGGEGCLTCTGTGGAGTGGEIQFSTSTGAAGTALRINGDIIASTEGRGGYGIIGGGTGTGGTTSSTYASASAITLNGDVDFLALGYGGDSDNGNGGTGTGGRAFLGAQTGATGTLTVTGNASTDVSGFGGDALGSGTGGFGRGGQTDNGGSAGTINFQGNFTGLAMGTGGSSASGTGGFALGGDGWVDAFGATITINGDYSMDVSAVGGDGATGGNATGGNGYLSAITGLTLDGDATVTSNGSGGNSFFGPGGNGQGGLALIRASAGATLTIGGDATAIADAFGGYTYDFSDGVGGDGVGGTARIQAFTTPAGSGTIDIEGGATVSANGNGGDSYSFVDGVAGDGTGGTAQLYAIGGTLTVGNGQTNGGASLSADGFGGDSENGFGGNGTGGTLAEIAAVNGDITIAGFASVSASGEGGDGYIGGDGLGSGDTTNEDQALWTGGARIFAQNGDIVIDGGAGVSAVGTGGDGGLDENGYEGDLGGNGGSGTGGWATIHSANGNAGPSSISIDSGILETSGFAIVTARGVGGNGGDGASGNAGGDGGDGGAATGGRASITAAAGNGAVNIGVADLDATALGGSGGRGGNGDGLPGGDGGNGGDATGGIINVGTESGSGQSAGVNNGVGTYGSIFADSSATGGSGGDGNFGSTSGAGGNGGDATGGASILLVRGSLLDVDNVSLFANATGGNGGAGDGETSADGNGGNATIGGDFGIGVIVTGRFLIPTQRGTLDAGSINGTAIATAGLGEIDGLSQTLGGNGIFFSNADGAIGSIDFLVQADGSGIGAIPDPVVVRNGDVEIEGLFRYITSGSLSLYVDNGSLTAGDIIWQAADFAPDVQYGVPETVAGTFFAGSFDISTQNNFLTTANLDSVQSLTIVAPGAIQIGNVTGDNDITLTAQSGEIEIGNVDAGGGVSLDADDFVSTGNVVANGTIEINAGSTIGVGTILNNGNTSLLAGVSINVGAIDSGSGAVQLISGTASIDGDVVSAGSIFADSGDDLFLGNLTAPGDIELVAAGDMIIGNALAGEYIDLDAGGYIDGGSMTAGASVYAAAVESVDFLDVSAGIVDQSFNEGVEYNVGILAGTTIETGDIAARDSIGLGAIGDIYTGSIDAGNIFLALGGGNMSFGEINAGATTYLADDSMIALGGDPTDGDFDPTPILAAAPTPTGGSIELRGPVTTGRFVAAAGGTIGGSTIDSDSSIYTVSGGDTDLTDLDAGSFIFQRSSGVITENDLNAGGYIDVRASNGLDLGNLIAGDYIDLRSNGAIGLGDATSGETIYLLSGTSITGGDLTAGDSVLGETNGAIQLGNISAGITDQSSAEGAEYAARFSSGASVTTGNVTALGRIGLGSVTDTTTGNLDSGEGLMALIGGNLTTGAIEADDYVYIANNSMAALGGEFLTFDRTPILALAPVATGGSIVIGAVNTGDFDAAAGTTFTGTTINSGNQINASSGGNMTLGDLFANNDIRLTSGGNIVTGNIESGDDIGIFADGSITTNEILAYDDITVDAGTSITTDGITGNTIDLLAGGAINTGDLLTQDFFFGELQLQPGASITVIAGGDVSTGTIDSIDGVYVEAGGSITSGNIVANDVVGLYAAGNLSVGTINAGADLVALVGDDATFGAITTPERFFLGGYGMFALVNDGESYDPGAVFDTEQKSSTGGSASFTGASSVESFEAYVGEDTTIASLTASDFASLDTGDLLSISGAISGGYITLTSSDIAIGQSAQINAPEGISFLSINSVGTFIGDDLPGETGYRLSQAEVDRVNANQLEFEVQTERGAAGLMRLGNLDLEVSPGAEDDGNVEFSISSEDEEGGTGIIRVVGDVNVTLGSEQMVEFEAQTFEIDAATGSLALTNTQGALSGILSLEASNIFIASGDILTRLEANPQYAGFREELNAPAAVQRPDGIVRAALVTLGEDAVGLENILIQNTGTTDLPAGFLVDVLTFYSDDEDELPPAAGSINMVINGQVQTESGTVTGVAVRDGLVEEFGAELIGIFVAGSTINGCPLTGACIGTPPTPPPPPPVDTITPTDVQINDPAGLGDGLFGNEPDIDDGEEGDGGDLSSPIAAPVPLFDSRPLNADGDVDDPVSGAGNPSLIGTSSEEECDTNEDGSCKPAEQGDKK
ncbi:MAG: hypothetical protein V4696_00870 [Pseudomonadota bacterium]